MVNFGKVLVSCQLQEWKEYYINYKMMKKKVKQYVELTQNGGRNHEQVLKEFSRMLDDQIEKVVFFLLKQQGHLASRIEKLGEEHAILTQQSDISRVSQVREAYRQVGLDLVKLLRFVDMNATGIRKILKKFDKRSGCGFTDYYVSTRANHPFSQLQPIFKQVDPVIEQINHSVQKLTHTATLLKFLEQNTLVVPQDVQTRSEDLVDDQSYHFMSLMLNLVNTFLYMVNTYIIVPTADDYSVSLGAAATVCGVIIGSMAVAQVFSSIYFSAWSNKSYFRPLVFSSIMLFSGNLLYALAYDLNSLAILILGRLLCGLGSARAVNRRYISDCVPLEIRLKAAAWFVSASALGMACGPALAGLLQIEFKMYAFTFNQNTLPGWIMCLAWVAYLFWLWISFKEPDHIARENAGSTQSSDSAHRRRRGDNLEGGLVQPFLTNERQDENVEGNDDDNEENRKECHKPATSIAVAYRLLTPTVKVQLLIYFMLKFAMEILLSESSVVTTFYFNWSTSAVAVFLAVLGLTVLPVNVIVGSCITNLFQDRQILVASEVMVLIGIAASFHLTSNYSIPQYVSSALITFVFAEVLEGVNLSLLSKVMSSRLSRGTYNGGLLSTEAGTLARVAADATITAAGYLGERQLLNATLLPSLVICVASIAATFYTYNSLY